MYFDIILFHFYGHLLSQYKFSGLSILIKLAIE